MAQFKFDEGKCDVVDRHKLKRYREHAERWFAWLASDEEHAISKQLSDLLWHDAVFRVLNEARRLAGAEASASRAPLLAQFIDQGYVSGQVLGISKLVESSPDGPNTTRGVVSLKRVVDELSANRDIFTREIFVAHDGLPYDYTPVEQAFLADQSAKRGTQPALVGLEIEGPKAWDSSKGLHELFDRLAGLDPAVRQRDDRLPDRVFDTLAQALEDPVFAGVRALRHKRLAHAADAISRLHSPPKSGLKLDDTARAHRILLGVLQAISAGVLHGAWRGAAIPVAQFDIFEHFPEPLIRLDQVERLRQTWDEIAVERDRWLAEGYSNFLGLPA